MKILMVLLTCFIMLVLGQKKLIKSDMGKCCLFYNNTADVSCGDNFYGEVEKYAVNIDLSKSAPLTKETASIKIGVYQNANDRVFKGAIANEEIGLRGSVLVDKQSEKSDKVIELPIEEYLESGIYTLQIFTNDRSIYRKLVVE